MYNFREIEKKWQGKWYNEKSFKAIDFHPTKPKYYVLYEFYNISGNLHMGHLKGTVPADALARMKRLQGYNVLFPMGWDAFGLPTENYAIKNKIHPAVVTEKNIEHFKEQLKMLGLSFDWEREVNTTDPEYFKWTQWIFLQMFKKGLAYKKEMAVNWCTSCKVVLANEEVVGGVCERCGGEVVRKVKSQWMLKITEYAQRLLDDLSEVNYLDKIKSTQTNWIGRSTGAEVNFESTAGDVLTVYTTRPDTLFGATYMVIAPEHPYIEKWADKLDNMDEIKAYQEKAARKSDFERTEIVKEKTGVELKGVKGINPVNGREIPIFISDYVLMSYGTGAIMAVPAHDTRDYEFAKVYGLPVIEVVKGGDIEKEAFTDCAAGEMVNSGFLDGLSVEEAKVKIKEWLEENGKGKPKVNFKLRDWVFSRQRYWGEPIPVVHCEKCGYVALPESELPLTLPDVDSYMPTDNGESPLSTLDSFINTVCPHCGGAAKRETDTMPQWAGSSWYFLRYCDPDNKNELASKEAIDYWMPVDWYNGGMEHTTLHLLYSRFWHKFLYDIEMFIGDFEKTEPWSPSSIKGCKRFLDRVWGLLDIVTDGDEYSEKLVSSFHKTIKKVSEDIESLKFNTAIAAMMALINDIYSSGSINRAEFKTLLILLNPFAPHITEELFEIMDFGGVLNEQKWPEYDEKLCIENNVEIVVQVNGKIKAKLMIPVDGDKDEILSMAAAEEKVKEAVDGKTMRKQIYVPNKLVNFVVS